MPKISFIVPFYNVEKYIGQCLDSLVNQILADVEILCVDDCGTDGSRAIVQQYMNKDPRIKLITHKENKGLGGARNTGVQHATGEYIWFIDSDDIIRNDAAETLYNLATQQQVSGICFEYTSFINDAHFSHKLPVATLYQPTDFLYFLTHDPKSLMIRTYAWRFLINRTHYITTNFSFAENVFYEDWYTPLIFLQSTIIYTPYEAYGYRQRNDSLSQNTSAIMASRILDSLILNHTTFLPKLLSAMNIFTNNLAQDFIKQQTVIQICVALQDNLARAKLEELTDLLQKEIYMRQSINFTQDDWNRINHNTHNASLSKRIDYYIFAHLQATSIEYTLQAYKHLSKKYWLKKMIKVITPKWLLPLYRNYRNRPKTA
jgi:glycosyltransferase involved in cell wall biosynthesis